MRAALLALACAAAFGQLPGPKPGQPLAGRKGDAAHVMQAVEVVQSGKQRVLVDGAGIVRRVFGESAQASEIEAQVQQWKRGKGLYESYCQRCHGPDGKDTTYAGTKSLGGIGSRLSEPRIIEVTGRTGSVDMSAFTPQNLKDLGVFIAGL